MQKIETQKAADQAVLETKTLLKSLSVSKAAYSKIYFRLKRLPTDASSPKKREYLYLPLRQSSDIVYNSTTGWILAWRSLCEEASINTLAHNNEGQFDVSSARFI